MFKDFQIFITIITFIKIVVMSTVAFPRVLFNLLLPSFYLTVIIFQPIILFFYVYNSHPSFIYQFSSHFHCKFRIKSTCIQILFLSSVAFLKVLYYILLSSLTLPIIIFQPVIAVSCPTNSSPSLKYQNFSLLYCKFCLTSATCLNSDRNNIDRWGGRYLAKVSTSPSL